MKKKILISSISIFVGTLLLSIFALVPLENIGRTSASNWLSKVDDSTKIEQLSLPGTHDSGAAHSFFDVAGKCQDLNIKSQLNIGVRFLDLRLQAVDNKFKIVHSFVDQALGFDAVLKDMTSFLKDNPSEFLLVSIKQEESSVNTDLYFDELLDQYFQDYRDYISYSRSLPNNVGEARGKIHIISRFSTNLFGLEAHYGWSDDTTFSYNGMYVQDNYCINSVEEKINDIKNVLAYAKNNTNELILNFTSCYLDNGFPPLYAGTPANTINPWLIEFLEDDTTYPTGVVVSDFISSKLAETIYRRNLA